jgi:hypothetical protein
MIFEITPVTLHDRNMTVQEVRFGLKLRIKEKSKNNKTIEEEVDRSNNNYEKLNGEDLLD